jgi:hypothetical protein
MFLVLQSWSKTPVKATVHFFPGIIGFEPGKNVYDALRGEYGECDGKTLKAELSFPYETGIYIIGNTQHPKKVLFTDNFDAGLNPGWDYVAQYLTIKDGALSFSENRAPWQGLPRIFKWLNLPDFSDAELSFSFDIEKKPENAAEIFSVRFPADGVEWSKHGLSHSYVKGGIELHANTDPKRGFVWRAFGDKDGKRTILGEGISGPADTARHMVNIRNDESGRYVVSVDGKTVIDCSTAVKGGNAFGISSKARNATSYVAFDIDDISLSAEKSSRKRLDAERIRALAVASEILKNDKNELKDESLKVFGIRQGGSIYNLALFRNPEQNVGEIGTMMKNADSQAKKILLIRFMKELPAMEKEHVDAMKKIGQPADRLPQFKKARQDAMRILQDQLKGADKQTEAIIADALTSIKE